LRAALQSTMMLLAVLAAAPAGAAETQLKPFFGATFGGSTTFVDPETASGTWNPVIGVSGVFLGEMFGAEVDVFDAPGFFETGDKELVRSSHVVGVTGNVIVAAPRRLTEYSLRPYLVAGVGLMHLNATTTFGVFDLVATIPAFDIGAGAVAFVTNRVGVSWELRRFQSVGENRVEPGLTSTGELHLSYWRATMAVVIRY
jgi:hypothetical protein